MRRLSFKWLALAIVGAMLFLGGYNLSIADRQSEIDEVIEQNNAVFQEIQHAFDLTVQNSDIMMRFSHHTDGHETKVPFCPECFNTPDGNDDMNEIEDHEVEIERSMKQLLLDSIEFEEAFQRMSSAMANHGYTLQHTLNQLREQNK